MRCSLQRMSVLIAGVVTTYFIIFSFSNHRFCVPVHLFTSQEEEQLQLQDLQDLVTHHETSTRSAPTIRKPVNFSAPMNVSYEYLAGTPLAHKKYLTVGLASVKRKKGSYLMDTLESIFEKSSDQELEEMVVVVHLSDFDIAWCGSQVEEIQNKFSQHITAGHLLVVHTPKEYYPTLDGLKRNYNDAEDRVRYRSKQNVDYAYLVNFCANLSQYYIMLEDDVRCSRNFLTSIKKAIGSRKQRYWVTMEFSKLGYIGKLYQSKDLPLLAHFLLMFYQEMPCDWLFTHFRNLLVQQNVIRFKPSLFQHMGQFTSFSGRIKRLKDNNFIEDPLDIPDNPPASLYTNIMAVEKHEAAKAYSTVSKEYFWGKSICTGNFFTVVLTKPTKLRRIKVVTGTEEHHSDILFRGTLEVGTKVVRTKLGKQCSSFVTLAPFKGGRVDVADVHHKVAFNVACVRLVVSACQKNWLIINTIGLWTV